MKLTLAVSIT